MAKRKKKGLTLRNDAGFTRHYMNRETGERVTLRPGINPGISGRAVERLVKVDKRFEMQINEEHSGSINEDRADALERLTKAVTNGDMSIADVKQPTDAIRVVLSIDSIKDLMEIYRQCRRLSVRSQVVRRLRLLGYNE